MALLPLEVIQVMSPDLAAHAMVEQFIALAKIRTANVRAGGFNEEKWALAVALRAMHMMTLQLTRPLGEAGSIAMKIEGELHLSFSDKALQISASNGSTIKKFIPHSSVTAHPAPANSRPNHAAGIPPPVSCTAKYSTVQANSMIRPL